MTSPTWQPNPNSTEGWQCDELVTEEGEHVARVEDFGYACYPSALNAKTGNWERGGAYRDRVEAILWAERVAGLHPSKRGDERPAFYYAPEVCPRCNVVIRPEGGHRCGQCGKDI